MSRKQIVFRDVTTAVAKKVFRIPPNDWSVFDEDMVPSKDPPDGLKVDRAAWLKFLNLIEGELHDMSPEYRTLNLGPADADKTIDKPILEICIYIRDRILKAPAIPKHIARLEKKAAAL